jgi:hypothetical protein
VKFNKDKLISWDGIKKHLTIMKISFKEILEREIEIMLAKINSLPIQMHINLYSHKIDKSNHSLAKNQSNNISLASQKLAASLGS